MNAEADRLTEDILLGTPFPHRGRWQPLRAGIAGIFHYDSQEFTLYNGRLLLRGNNGNGKSMALEVLLPFVLDADLAPERLSTFGGKSRGMYTWLLGHDGAKGRDSARGYVWVEFGRLGSHGEPEYFTVGAGLEATRASGKVQPWYFTTAARVGVDFVLTKPGSEAPKKDILEQRLAECAAAGLPGLIHPDADTHRARLNQVLFGLDRYKFDALRKALLQLRRPKLSDRLSERGLAEILRDSLAPLDAKLLMQIADGYERLDRHHDDVKAMRTTLAALRALETHYQTYARAELLARATAMLDGVDAAKRAETEAGKRDKELERLRRQADDLTKAITNADAETERLQAQLDGLKLRDLYTRGADLEPLREQAKDRRRTAIIRADEARKAQAAASDAAQKARKHAEAAEAADRAAVASRRLLEETADAPLVTDLHRRWAAELDRRSDDADELWQTLRITARADSAALREQIGQLQRITEEAAKAERDAEAKDELVEQARQQLTELRAVATRAAEHLRTVQQAHRELLRAWVAASTQLTSGLRAPHIGDGTAHRDITTWARAAHDARTAQLATVDARIGAASGQHDSLREELTGFDAIVTAAGTTLQEAQRTSEVADQAAAHWHQQAHDWYTALTELALTDFPAGPPRIDAYQAWLQNITIAARRRHEAINEAHGELARQGSLLDQRKQELLDQRTPLEHEQDRLERGEITSPAAPPTRLADRHDRPGAPLFMLVDFADAHLQSDKAAALEAALHASGIADAWVSPEGSLLIDSDRPLADTQLHAHDDGRSSHPLAAALRPDPIGAANAGVDEAVISELLGHIELADTATTAQHDRLTVGWDGSWRAGPLHGAYRQEHAGLIGAASREGRRQAELETVAGLIAAIDEQLSSVSQAGKALERQTADLNAAAQRVNREASQFPSIQQVRESADAAAEAQRHATMSVQDLVRQAKGLYTDFRALAAQGHAVAALTGVSQQHLVPLAEAPAPPPPASLPALTAYARTVHEHTVGALSAVEALLRCSADQTRQHRQRLGEELRNLPSTDALDQAVGQSQDADRQAETAQSAFMGLLADQTEARAFAHQQAGIRDAALTDTGLAGHLDRLTNLPAISEAWQQQSDDLLRHLQIASTAQATASELAATAETALHDAKYAVDKAEAEAGEAQQLWQRYASLSDAIGKPYADIVAEIQNIEAAMTALRDVKNAAADKQAILQPHIADATGKAATAADTLRQLRDRIPDLAERLRTTCSVGLPEAAQWAAPDDPVHLTTDKLIATAQLFVDAAGHRARGDKAQADLDNAMNATSQARHDADVTLGGQFALLESWSDGLLLIETIRQGQTRPLATMISEIRTDLIAAETVLKTDEAQLLEEFLTDDVRKQVVARIDAARSQLRTMNDLMERHPTTSGLTIRLNWRPDPDAGIPAEVVDLLAADFDAAPSARTRLRGFFQDRIAAIRATRTGRTWPELLAEMLDYRRWYRFDIEARQKSGDWSRLSSASHNALSGGEKSIALHLPLFTAAATHTVASTVRDTTDNRRPGCPRLILLDEIFAGVDEDNRGSLFEVIRSLDMDLIATSEAETGMYAELDGIAIYHLIKGQSIPGVLGARSVWTGKAHIDLLDNDLNRIT